MSEERERYDNGLPPAKTSGRRQMWRNVIAAIVLAALLVYVLFILPMPYYIFMPGTAEEVRPMVHVKMGPAPEKGTFMLTTVGVAEANIAGLFWAKVSPYQEIFKKSQILQDGQTDKEYNEEQSYNMMASQSSAIQAAYKKIGVPFHIRNDGVMILRISKDMPAAKTLQAGDVITAVDGKPVAKTTELTDYMKTKNAGDTVQLTYKRGKDTKTDSLTLANLPAPANAAPNPNAPKAGLGVVIAQVQSVQADNPEQQVSVSAEEIGGPSAGLMFSLEIYNQLVPGDLTKGYRVAGTGTIDEEGKVGVIGGIQHKVVAADRQKAEIFFAPKDWIPPEGSNYQPIKNFSTAQDEANKIHSKMKVVPVETMDDAMRYLNSLPPKG